MEFLFPFLVSVSEFPVFVFLVFVFPVFCFQFFVSFSEFPVSVCFFVFRFFSFYRFFCGCFICVVFPFSFIPYF